MGPKVTPLDAAPGTQRTEAVASRIADDAKRGRVRGMILAADLHLHSHRAGGVSPAMTAEAIARVAMRKGLDLLGTGDALQAEWLDEIETVAEPSPGEPGLLRLRAEAEARAARDLPAGLRRPLRYAVTAEVDCAPPGTPELGGLHHLLFFPSIEHARGFRARMERHGDLREGRPTLALDSRSLLEELLDFDPACRMAPAHVFNPWYSSLGTVAGKRTLAETFGDLAPLLVAVETGLTSTPPMCRRVSCLDGYTLFSCSDAPSLDNIGREHTLLDLPAPGFEALMGALERGEILGTVKVPVVRTRYYLNRCGACQASFDARRCPRCRRALVSGSRDRLEIVADRVAPVFPENAPPFRELPPLAQLLAEQMGVPAKNPAVREWEDRLLAALGHERRILAEAGEDEIARVSTAALARAIVRQRAETPGPAEPGKPAAPAPSTAARAGGDTQLGLGL